MKILYLADTVTVHGDTVIHLDCAVMIPYNQTSVRIMPQQEGGFRFFDRHRTDANGDVGSISYLMIVHDDKKGFIERFTHDFTISPHMRTADTGQILISSFRPMIRLYPASAVFREVGGVPKSLEVWQFIN